MAIMNEVAVPLADEVSGEVLTSDAIGASLDQNETQVEEDFDLDPKEVNEVAEEVSAFLFVSPKPLSLEKLLSWTRAEEPVVEAAIKRIQSMCEQSGFGFELVEIGGSFQMRTKASLATSLRKMITPKMKRLSKAAAETLAVVAYKQPVSKAEIEAIRGVDALPTLKTLIEAKLIRIVGREEAAGHPALYGSTDYFLEKFGLKDLSQLPTVREAGEMQDELSECEESEDDSDDFGSDDIGSDDLCSDNLGSGEEGQELSAISNEQQE